MGKLRFQISMSVDGFIAGPNQSEEHPLGEGGEQLHEWALKLAAWREPLEKQGGTRLFESTGEISLEPTRVLEGPDATHLRYRVVNDG